MSLQAPPEKNPYTGKVHFQEILMIQLWNVISGITDVSKTGSRESKRLERESWATYYRCYFQNMLAIIRKAFCTI